MERRIVNILDYGAKAGAGTDCTVPVQKAMEEIKERKEPATLFFPKGEYHFHKEYALKRFYHTSNTNSLEYPVKEIGFLIEDQKDLWIDGDGSLFIFHGNMMALAIVNSNQIKLNHFSWDFPCATVSEMEVESVFKNQVTYKVPFSQTYEVKDSDVLWYEKSPLTGDTYWNFKNQEFMEALVLYQPWDKTAIRCREEMWPLSHVKDVTELEDHRLQVTYTNKDTDCYKAGMCFEICRNAYRETAGAFIWESKKVRIEDVTVHYLHSFGWLTQMCNDVSFVKCRFIPRENTGRRATGFADLIHVSGAGGEIRIEECRFGNAHDDSINIHGTFTRVKEMMDNHTLLLEYVHNQQGGFPQYHPGDKVIFYARDTLQGVNGEKEYTVDNRGTVMSDSGRVMQVTFMEELPDFFKDKIGTEGKYVAENVTYTPSVIIKKCYFETIPTRGILCTSRKKVIIEENEFHGMSMPSVFISNDSENWYESGPVRDMEIRNNIFFIWNPYGTEPDGNTAISIDPVVKGGKLPGEDFPIHKNIRIHHNLFYLQNDKVLTAKNVENLLFYNNKIIRTNEKGEIIKKAQKHKLSLLSLIDCKKVKVYNNEYDCNTVYLPDNKE